MKKHRWLLEQLLDRRDLGEDDAVQLLTVLLSAETSAATAGALLAALTAKGVTVPELRGFASTMRKLARQPHLPMSSAPLVDLVGTGGDNSCSFNLSTGASLLVAALGLQVAKHGTSSVSSRSGSADVIRALGLPLPLDERAAGECLARTGFTFLFAPHYHPVMHAIMPVRQALGVRTIFNILGPLLNPAEPDFCLIGAYHLDVARLMAGALCDLRMQRSYVVHGADGWDEATPVGPFHVFDVAAGCVSHSLRSAEEFGLEPCAAEDLSGGDAAYNAQQLRAVLLGEERGAHRDAIVLQAALVLELTGKASDPWTAAQMAQECLDSGAAGMVLTKLAEFGHRLYERELTCEPEATP
jgi:anthranilate phosphoribosyltransferase